MPKEPPHRHNGGPLSDEDRRKLWGHIRALEEIAEQLHGEPLPEEEDDDTVHRAAAKLEQLARDGGITMTLEAGGQSVTFGDGQHETPFEELLIAARRIVVLEQKASTSWLQRQMRIGYNTAARIIEKLQADGVVSAPDETGKRAVLLTSVAETAPAAAPKPPAGANALFD